LSELTPLPAPLVRALAQRFGDRFDRDPGRCWPYGGDNSRLHSAPAAVVFVRDHDEVVALVQLCNRYRVPFVGRGHGTGTAGAAVAPLGGVVIAFEQMDRIIRVDGDNRLLITEPAATNQAVQQAAAAAGFFWPCDPTSAAICTVGGNLACNAAGPLAVKYGTPRENVLGLRAVTGDGRALRTGSYTTKGVVGYDLTRLLIGSEGTLALITEATLKLTPLPEARRMLRASYRDMGAAARAVARLMAQPITPCTLEFMDSGALQMIRDYSQAQLPTDAGAMLLLEVDGAAASLDAAVATVSAVAQGGVGDGCLELLEARDPEQVQQLWATRKALSPALRTVAPKKINEDVVVPVSHIPTLIDAIAQLAQRHAITIVNFGHAGNGNIHVNLLIDPDDPAQLARAQACLDALFDQVLALQGSISGEHGIGVVKRPFVSRELDPVALSLMHAIRQQFDPLNLLNPGKKLPSIDAV